MAYTELQVVAETNYWHVSNVKLFEYLDQARIVWYEYCKSYGVQPLVVNININYQREAFNNEILHICTKLDRVGNTSFTLKQTILKDKKNPVASADVVLALIDLQTKQKIRVPFEIRRLLDQDTPLY